MTTQLHSIMIALGNFPFFAVLFTLPILVVTILKYKTINYVRIGFHYAALLYFLALFAVVFLPLPSAELAARMSTHEIQLVPFHFVVDIIKESSFQLTNPATYLTCLCDRAVLQVVFNVVMTVPFGILLRYYFGCSKKRVLAYTFVLSLFIEVTQLTGIYGIYHGSYRLCDMDDLIANTVGGYVGYQIVNALRMHIPEIERFDIVIGLPSRNHYYM